MVKATDFVSAKYLSAKVAKEFNGKKYTIDTAFSENINDEDKLCIRLSGVDRPLALNQTNLSVLMAAFGDDTDSWVNQKVILKIVKVSFNGKLVDGIQLEPVNSTIS